MQSHLSSNLKISPVGRSADSSRVSNPKAASAKRKRTRRREILEDAGIEATSLRSIDEVDAALCALTANFLLEESIVAYGDELGGFIVVPVPTGHRRL